MQYSTVWSRDRTVDHIPRCIALNIHGKTEHVQPAVLLANSLEYPERIQRGLEWTQFLKRLLVLCLLVCKQIFSFFIQYSTEECSTVQLFIYNIIAVMIDIDTS